MNLDSMLPSDEMIYRLGWTLIHTLWLGTAVAVVFAVTMAALRHRSAQSRYLAGCAAMVALMVGAVAVFFFIQPLPARPAVQAPAPVVATTDDKALFDPDAATNPPLTAVPVEPVPIHAEHPMVPVPAPDTKIVAATAAKPDSVVDEERPLLARVAGALEPALPWLVLVWTVGVCILALWQLTGWIAAQRLKRLAVRPANAGLVGLVERLARKLGVARAVKLLESALIRVPTVIGWLRPVILLPLGFAAGLSPAQVESILVHELGHIRRYDYLINLLQSLVETLLFYHPATWYISRRVRLERENCCDDLTLAAGANQFSYAEGLLHLAQQSAVTQSKRRRPIPAAAGVGAAGKPSELRSRIGRVLGRNDHTSRLARSWPIVLCALILALASGSAFLSSCVSDSSKHDQSITARQFKEATITVRMDLQTGKSVPSPTPQAVFKLDKPEDLADLLAFFPDRNHTPWVRRSAGWEAGAVIELKKSDGSIITIHVSGNDELQTYSSSTSEGDKEVRGDLKAFLIGLQKQQPATQPTTQANKATFGPPIELAIEHPDEGWDTDTPAERVFLDIDTGKFVPLPLSLSSDWARKEEKLRAAGVDLYCLRLQGGEYLLRHRGMTFWRVAEDNWDTDAELVRELIDNGKPLSPVDANSSPGITATGSVWAFKTAEGTMGIIQVVGLVKGERPLGPLGWEIRYKLLQAAPTTRPSPLTPSTSSGQASSGPSTQPAGQWGTASNGVQARLRVDKEKWASGTTPTLRADIRNTGRGGYTVALAQSACELVLRGTRYRWVGDAAVKFSDLPPGGQCSDIPIALTDNWVKLQVMADGRRVSTGEKLKLVPGRYMLRVDFSCDGGSSQENVVVESNWVWLYIAAGGTEVTDLTFGELATVEPARPVQIETSWSVVEQVFITSPEGFLGMKGGHAVFKGFPRDLKSDSVVLVQTADLLKTALADIPAGRKVVIPREAVERIDRVSLLPASQPAAGKLEFRIAPTASAMDKDELAVYMADLKAGRVGFWWVTRPVTGRPVDHVWLPVAGQLTNADMLITGECDGKSYALVADKVGQMMTAGDGKDAWRVADAFPMKDNADRPAIAFELDNRGAELFGALTKANVDKTLAIIVDGQVVSAPVTRTALGKRGMILGKFSEQEVSPMPDSAAFWGLPLTASSIPARIGSIPSTSDSCPIANHRTSTTSDLASSFSSLSTFSPGLPLDQLRPTYCTCGSGESMSTQPSDLSLAWST